MKAIKTSALSEMVSAAIRLDNPMAFAVSVGNDGNVLSNVVFLPIETPDEVLDVISAYVGEVVVAHMRKQDFE